MRERNLRIVQISPCPLNNLGPTCQLQHSHIIDQCPVRQDGVDIKPEPFQNLHLRHNYRIFQVVKCVPKVRHRVVVELIIGLAAEQKGGPLEDEVVNINEVPHADGTFLNFGSKVQCAHADVLEKVALAPKKIEI